MPDVALASTLLLAMGRLSVGPGYPAFQNFREQVCLPFAHVVASVEMSEQESVWL